MKNSKEKLDNLIARTQAIRSGHILSPAEESLVDVLEETLEELRGIDSVLRDHLRNVE